MKTIKQEHADMADNLKEKTARGLFWGAVNSGGTQVLSLVIGIFLARQLSPAEYGVVGMLAIFTAVATNIQDSGFANALINLKSPAHRDYNAVFWFNVTASLAMYTLLFFCAPLIAAFFRQPVLVPMARLLFLGFVVASLGIAHNAYLSKNMMNREKAVIAIAAVVVSGVCGITLACLGMSYWSLVWQQLSYNITTFLGRLYYSPWRPTLHFDMEPVRRMFGFSSKILVTTLAGTASQNVLTLLFGRFYDVHSLGNYTQAAKWETMAHGFVSSTVAQVSQPVLSALNDDGTRQLRAFRKMLRFAAFISFPIMLGLALVADEFITIAITREWAGAIPLLQILCLSGAFAPFYVLYQHLAISRGRSDSYMWCNLSQIILQTALVIVLRHEGITVLVAAFTAFNILWLLVWQQVAGRMIGLRLRCALLDVLPFLAAALAVMAATHYATCFISQPLPLLATRIVVAAGLYFGLMRLARAVILTEAIGYLRGRH